MTTRILRTTVLAWLAATSGSSFAFDPVEWPMWEVKVRGDCPRVTLEAVKRVWPKLLDDDRGLPAQLPLADPSLVPRIVKAPLVGAVIGGKRVGSHAQRVYVRMLDYQPARFTTWSYRHCDLSQAYVVLPDLGPEPVVFGPLAERLQGSL